jgi:hypothetical protein
LSVSGESDLPAYDYRGENHDWDMTLASAGTLLAVGEAPGTDKRVEFATLTASMLLSLTAVESFTNSVAFLLPEKRPDLAFNHRRYKALRGFWPKVNKICSAASIKVSEEQSIFEVLAEAHRWRNLLVHTEPYSVTAIAIENTRSAIEALHGPHRNKEYTRSVTPLNARRFFEAAKNYVSLIMDATQVEPRASATYAANGQALRIQRNSTYE